MQAALTPRQARFVDEYVLCGNAAEAARRAGYSNRTARQIAHENLTKPDVKAAIEAKKWENAEQFELRREHIIAAIMQAIARAEAQSAPSIMIRGLVEVAKLCGFYDPELIKEERRRLRHDGSEDLRYVPTAELMQRISQEVDLRNPDGSAMRLEQIDAFYKNLETDDLLALAEGRARIEMRVVANDKEPIRQAA